MHQSKCWVNGSPKQIRISLNRSPLRMDACLELTLGVNQQIMGINSGPRLDAGVPRPNATYSLEVVHVEDDGREEKVLRHLV